MADAAPKKWGDGPRHYYKSGWVTKHGHGHMGGKMKPLTSLKTKKRWFRLRHYVMDYFEEEQGGYNSYGWPEDKEEDLDDDMQGDRSLLDKIPGLPDFKMPSLPSLPDLPDMPDIKMPDMPDMKMPDMKMPDMKMPDMKMPDLKNLKVSMPKKKEKREDGLLGRIYMYDGCKVKQTGKKIQLTNAHQVKFFKDSAEDVQKQTFNLECETEEEAYSWACSMVYGGAEKVE